jgi:hypothetical protein
MDEKHNIIKAKVDNAYERIKDAEKVLEECREQCDHPKTELVTYSTRPGQYWDDTEICSICGDVIKWKENPQMRIWTGTGRVNENTPKIKDEFQPGTIESWDDGGCSTGLGGDQYD